MSMVALKSPPMRIGALPACAARSARVCGNGNMPKSRCQPPIGARDVGDVRDPILAVDADSRILSACVQRSVRKRVVHPGGRQSAHGLGPDFLDHHDLGAVGGKWVTARGSAWPKNMLIVI